MGDEHRKRRDDAGGVERAEGVRAAVDLVLSRRRDTRADRATLVAVSGVDASGKGYLSAKVAAELRDAGLHAVVLNVDAWLDMPSVRFDAARPGETFYRKAVRFDEMLDALVLPLRNTRSVRVEARVLGETDAAFRSQTFEYDEVDVILLEGVFLLQPRFVDLYDATVWVECGFETALVRALRRGQEGLPSDETVRAYLTTYFPAQIIHIAADDPKSLADVLIWNDEHHRDDAQHLVEPRD